MTRLKTLKPRLAPAAAPRGWKSDAVRGTRQERGYGAAWERLRAQVLKRDEHLCQPCLKAGRPTVGTQVDHRIPKSQGGTDDLANLQTICLACHKAKTARESTGGGMPVEKSARG